MDNTALFRACVKAMKVRKKALGTRSQLGHGRAKPPDEHGSEARNVVSLVTALRDFLLSQREDYINASWLSTCASRLSESDRDRIDTHIETGMRDCRRLLDNLRRKMSMEPAHSSQRMAHLSAVLLITDAYLKDSPPEEDNLENRRKISSKPSKPALYIEGLYAENDNTSGENFDPSAHLTEEQRKQLMVENEVLLKKFQSQEDDVKRLETQVVEIGRLQALFTEKVMEQGSTVSHIGEMAVDSTENVKYGNDQLRQAASITAGIASCLFAGDMLLFGLIAAGHAFSQTTLETSRSDVNVPDELKEKTFEEVVQWYSDMIDNQGSLFGGDKVDTTLLRECTTYFKISALILIILMILAALMAALLFCFVVVFGILLVVLRDADALTKYETLLQPNYIDPDKDMLTLDELKKSIYKTVFRQGFLPWFTLSYVTPFSLWFSFVFKAAKGDDQWHRGGIVVNRAQPYGREQPSLPATVPMTYGTTVPMTMPAPPGLVAVPHPS